MPKKKFVLQEGQERFGGAQEGRWQTAKGTNSREKGQGVTRGRPPEGTFAIEETGKKGNRFGGALRSCGLHPP